MLEVREGERVMDGDEDDGGMERLSSFELISEI